MQAPPARLPRRRRVAPAARFSRACTPRTPSTPTSVTGRGRVARWFGDPAALPAGLPDEIARTGVGLVAYGRDPVADLIVVQRLAAALGAARGLDPDTPATSPAR